MFLLAVALSIALVLILVSRTGVRDKERLETWKVAAMKLGLHASLYKPYALHGLVSDVVVHVEPGRDRDGRPATIYTADVRGLISFELSTSSMKNAIALGDERFDAVFRVQGREEMIFAALSTSVRLQLLAIEQVSLIDGVLKIVGEADPRSETIVNQVQRLISLVEAMHIEGNQVAEWLLETFNEEWSPVAQRRQLTLLFRMVPDPKIRERAIDSALASDDPELNLIGAIQAGVRGEKALRELVTRPMTSDELRARALVRLATDAFDAGALSAMWAASGVKMRAAIAARLRHFPEDLWTEPTLIAALTDGSEAVRIAAARSLAVIGSLAAVEPLQRCAQGFFRSSLKEAARTAVLAIQARSSGGERGGLSLAMDVDDGALSLSAEAGALSVER